MINKILIGSVIAVAILIGVSFTSVVGYNRVASDVKASPLFTVRSSRAIDEDSKDIACDYVGKGKPTLFTFPKRNDKMTLVEKVTDGFR